MRVAVVLLALAACSPGDAAPPDATTCVATFGDNFADTTSSPAACATVTGGTLTFAIDSQALGSTLAIAIELGAAPAIGTYSSETIATWSTAAARSIDDGGCVYTAGDQVIPHGSFTLSLAAIDAGTAHGTLEVIQAVHALQGTDCGASDRETVDVVF